MFEQNRTDKINRNALLCLWVCKQDVLCRTMPLWKLCQYLHVASHHCTSSHWCLSSSMSVHCVRASAIRQCLCIIATWFSPTPTHSGCRSCTSVESVSTQVARPGKKAESSTDGSRSSTPSAPVQVRVNFFVKLNVWDGMLEHKTFCSFCLKCVQGGSTVKSRAYS